MGSFGEAFEGTPFASFSDIEDYFSEDEAFVKTSDDDYFNDDIDGEIIYFGG